MDIHVLPGYSKILLCITNIPTFLNFLTIVYILGIVSTFLLIQINKILTFLPILAV